MTFNVFMNNQSIKSTRHKLCFWAIISIGLEVVRGVFATMKFENMSLADGDLETSAF